MIQCSDGDTVSIKPRWTKESNEDAERLIRSNAYIIDIQGQSMRNISKDFIITQYMLTNVQGMKDINKTAPKYTI